MTHFDTEAVCQKEEDYSLPGTALPWDRGAPGTAAPQCGKSGVWTVPVTETVPVTVGFSGMGPWRPSAASAVK
ncbi:MAG: hypothetical protein NTV33_00555 [Coprothermobacterota bacterium]|nr:hypothetical protein [Coprothermobacterota bacterium]